MTSVPRVLVLGTGRQGRAVLSDLVRQAQVNVAAADASARMLDCSLQPIAGAARVPRQLVNAENEPALIAALAEMDLVIEMLPARLQLPVARAALESRTHLVNCHYSGELSRLHPAVEAAGLSFVAEAGLDPGLDLILAAQAIRGLDEVLELRSYGAGFPEPAAATGPTRYKITWSLEGVLSSYQRPARLLEDGREQHIASREIFAPQHIHLLDIPGVGRLEAYPNGDAVAYAARLGIRGTIQTTGRYVLRWPGHAALWYGLSNLGLLDDTPMLGGVASPRQCLARILEPQLAYRERQRDIAVARVEVLGLRAGRAERVVCQAIDRRDLRTGLFAMNRLVGFTASIVAQMILNGEIDARGVLSPACHVPPEAFLVELRRRDVEVSEQREPV